MKRYILLLVVVLCCIIKSEVLYAKPPFTYDTVYRSTCPIDTIMGGINYKVSGTYYDTVWADHIIVTILTVYPQPVADFITSGSGSAPLNLKLKAKDAGMPVNRSWSINGMVMAITDSFTLHLTNPGAYEIRLVVITPPPAQCAASLTRTIHVFNTGVNDPLPGKFVSISPNPTRDKVDVDFSIDCTGTIYLYDILGKLCLEEKIRSKAEQIDMGILKNGVYFIMIKSDVGSKTFRIFKD